jgi:hypothetical protein
VHHQHIALFFELQVFHLDNLPGFRKEETSVIVIVARTAVHQIAGFNLLKRDHITVAGKFPIPQLTVRKTADQAEERMLWRFPTIAQM